MKRSARDLADPNPGLEHAGAAETLGVGSIWVAERWEKREIAATLGALTQATKRVKLVAGVTHFGTRHPIVLAGMASTLQELSGNRFILGFGRSVAAIWKNLGIPVPVNAAMGDYARILRSLWAGETVNYDGPAGRYPHMRMAELPEVAPPLLLAAIGPKTLALAGQHFDGAVLHPFLTPEGVARSVGIVRKAAEEAGRDPAAVRIYAEVLVALGTGAGGAAAGTAADATRVRAASYFTVRDVGAQLVAMNGWDSAPMEKLLEEPDARAELTLPPHWLEQGVAGGSYRAIARRLWDYRGAGAEEIVLHGVSPEALGPLVHAYEES